MSRSIIGPTRLGNYEIVGQIGEGGMGVVYKARDVRLDRFVAVKTLVAERRLEERRKRRFSQEAKAASALNHPNIVTIYEIDHANGFDFIAMEFIEGRSLRELVGKPVDATLIVPVLRQIAEGLSVAHAAGIVHRDIKPDNVMLRIDGYVKILDFGIARLSYTDDPDDSFDLERTRTVGLTAPGVIVGTVRYLSPEQARGQLAESPADVFSLGILAYELATGRHPFSAGSQLQILNAILSDSPMPPSRLNPSLPSELDDLILRMLSKESILRPSAADLRNILASFGESASAVRQEPIPPPRRNSVGRKEEQQELNRIFHTNAGVHLQMVCVSGEPGMGKTTLVEDFLADVRSKHGSAWIGRGRCSERLSGTDAFLPFLEAIEGLIRGESGDQAARMLKRFSPTWYLLVAPSVGDSTVEIMSRDVKTASVERLKLELLTFFEELARLRPVILFFDDVHWADISTCDLIAYFGGKSSSLRLLIIATYRPSEMLAAKHPFHQVKLQLEGRGVSRDLQLSFLTEDDIAEYLTLQFPDNRLSRDFVTVIHQRTEGNPLFMADMLRYLRDRQIIKQNIEGSWELTQSLADLQREMPASVRSMVQLKIDRFSEEERRLMIAGAVQGVEFDSAVLAKVLDIDPIDVEESLQQLESIHNFIRLVGEQEFPDRTLTVRYRFVHVFYQNALYASLTPSRRAQMALNIARTIHGFYGDKVRTNAAELAVLYEAGRDFTQAAIFFNAAARNAARVFAYPETILLAERGQRASAALPETSDRARIELGLSLSLGVALMATRGYAAPEVEKTFVRSRDLCIQLGEHRRVFPVLWGLWTYYLIGDELKKADEVADQMMERWQSAKDPVAHIQALHAKGTTLGYLGGVTKGIELLSEAWKTYQADPYPFYASVYVLDPAVTFLVMLARFNCGFGQLPEALNWVDRATEIAQTLNHPQSLAYATFFRSYVLYFHRDYEDSRIAAETAMRLAKEHELYQIVEWCRLFRGWSLFSIGRKEEGLLDMRRSIDNQFAIRSLLQRPHCLTMLAEALLLSGDNAKALKTIDEAGSIAERHSELVDEPEILRIRAKILSAANHTEEAVRTFSQSAAVAQARGQKLYELRATRDWQRLAPHDPAAAEAFRSVSAWFETNRPSVITREMNDE